MESAVLIRQETALADKSVSKAGSLLSDLFVKTVIAIEKFRNDTGKLPESLNVLVPEYLDKIPEDYFSDGKVTFKKQDKGIWSIVWVLMAKRNRRMRRVTILSSSNPLNSPLNNPDSSAFDGGSNSEKEPVA